MRGHLLEVAVGCEHHEIMSDAELRQERVDRPDLDALTTTRVSDLSGSDMVGPVRHEKGQRRESNP